MNEIEEGEKLCIDFNKLNKIASNGISVIPVVIQDDITGEVLLLAYTNEEAFKITCQTGRLVLWSTSRNELWEKGKSSGNTYKVISILVNCEQNSLLYRVKSEGKGICHTLNKNGIPRKSCFYRKLDTSTGKLIKIES